MDDKNEEKIMDLFLMSAGMATLLKTTCDELEKKGRSEAVNGAIMRARRMIGIIDSYACLFNKRSISEDAVNGALGRISARYREMMAEGML